MNWVIERLDCLPDLNGIKNYCVTAYWRVTATDGDFTDTAYGTCSFEVPETLGKVVPFDKLTEEQVLGWVWQTVDKDAIEASLAAQLDAQRNPRVIAPKLPWSK